MTPVPVPPAPDGPPLSLEDTIRELSKRAAERGERLAAVIITRDEYNAAVRDNNVGEVLQWMIANPSAWQVPGDKRFPPIPCITFENVSFYIQDEPNAHSTAVTYNPGIFAMNEPDAHWAMQIYPLHKDADNA